MRIRWSHDPDELPGPGEALAWLRHTRVETVPRPGGRTMTRFAGYQMSITTHDGRSLVAEVPGSESAHTAPLVPSDAPGDLVELLNRAWLARQRPGRPKGYTTIDDDAGLRDAVRRLRRDNRRPTQLTVAAFAGYTKSAIRGYLDRTGQTWAEFLASF